ncbi:MAG: alpha/beta hydrolase, partial [Patescibacteria group bacterium]
AVASAAAGYARSKFVSETHQQGVAIHIHGGTGAGPGLYHPWRNFLLSSLYDPPPIHLPRRIIFRAAHLPRYDELIPTEAETAEIHIGHSVGGLVCLRRLVLHPEKVLRVILVGTPVNPEYIHPWAAEYIVKRILGIHAAALPTYLESLKTILEDPTLQKKITVISSDGDKFFPPEACFIPGAEYVEVPNCSHIGFVNKKEAKEAIGNTVDTAISPARQKLKAA